MLVVEYPTACSMHPADLLACSSFKLIEYWLQKSTKLCKANYPILLTTMKCTRCKRWFHLYLG